MHIQLWQKEPVALAIAFAKVHALRVTIPLGVQGGQWKYDDRVSHDELCVFVFLSNQILNGEDGHVSNVLETTKIRLLRETLQHLEM
jgi:hypothetical protein